MMTSSSSASFAIRRSATSVSNWRTGPSAASGMVAIGDPGEQKLAGHLIVGGEQPEDRCGQPWVGLGSGGLTPAGAILGCAEHRCA